MAQSRSIVRPAGDPLVGTSPTEMRLALAALLSHSELDVWGVRPGVLWGGAVRGTAGWAYEVDPAALVTVRGALQGAYPAAITGVQTVNTDPAPASGSRIDITYLLQHDVDLGDTDNDPVIDVAIGTASGAPTAPVLPDGALELGRATITSLMTQTLDATVATTAPITRLHGARYTVPAASALTRIADPVSGDEAMTASGIRYIYLGGEWVLYDTGWINTGVTWASNWADYQPLLADNHFEYRREGKLVQLRGLARRTAGASANQTLTILTLPTGIRPSRSVIKSALTNGAVETQGPSTGTAHTHVVGSASDTRSTGAQMRVQIASTGVISLGIGVGQSLAADNWVSMSEIDFLID